MPPREFERSFNIRPVETIVIGTTTVTQATFEAYLRQITPQWTCDTYSLLRHNCNHFSDTVVNFLTGKQLPSRILNQADEFLSTPLGRQLGPMIEAFSGNMSDRVPGTYRPPPPVPATTSHNATTTLSTTVPSPKKKNPVVLSLKALHTLISKRKGMLLSKGNASLDKMKSRLEFKEKLMDNLPKDPFAVFYILRLSGTSSTHIESVMTWIEENRNHDAYCLALAALTNLVGSSSGDEISTSLMNRILPLCVSALKDVSFYSRRVGTSLLHNILVNLTMRKARQLKLLKSCLSDASDALRDALRDRSGKDEEIDRTFLLCLARVSYVSIAFLRVKMEEKEKDEKMVGMLGRFERLRGGWTRDIARVLRKLHSGSGGVESQ